MEKYSYRSGVDTDPSQKTIESVLFSSFFRAELRCCLVPLAPLNPHFDRQLSMLRGLEARQPVRNVSPENVSSFLDFLLIWSPCYILSFFVRVSRPLHGMLVGRLAEPVLPIDIGDTG